MRDLISRQDAIDAINQICPIDTEYDCTLLDRVDVRYVLTDLPSAQQTADVVSKEKYDELNGRYHRLLESANILVDAVREYERREDAN